MPGRPNEKTYTVAREMLWKVALVAFYQPKTSGSEQGSASCKLSVKLVYAMESRAYSSSSQRVWKDQQLCLLDQALGDK